MRMILSLGKALRHRDSSTLIVRLCPTISSVSISGIRKLVVKIPRMDTILIGYYIVRQVRTMMSSVIYKITLKTGEKYLGGS